MFLDELSRERAVDERSVRHAEQRVFEKWPHRTAHPPTNGHPESHLLPTQNLVGERSLHQATEKVLGFSAPELHPGGEVRHKLDEFVIEEWGSTLERRCHCCDVHFYEEITRQVCPAVDRKDALERINWSGLLDGGLKQL